MFGIIIRKYKFLAFELSEINSKRLERLFMMCFVFRFGMFHAFIKLFTGKTELFTVLYVPEHEVVEKFIQMVFYQPK